jgi:hypothetical protein
MTVLGSLSALLTADNQGDVIDEVFILCDALGIERPEEEDGQYRFPWQEEDEDDY